VKQIKRVSNRQSLVRGRSSCEAGEIVLKGTWSAQKMGESWQGTWTARALKGAPLSGTWNADLPSFNGKTIHAMLERTAEREVAGFWRTRGYQGNWCHYGSWQESQKLRFSWATHHNPKCRSDIECSSAGAIPSAIRDRTRSWATAYLARRLVSDRKPERRLCLDEQSP
jgi:hypothetical protein